MPVKNQVPPQEVLESILFSGGSETSFFSKVESYLDTAEEKGPQECSKRLMDRLQYLAKKELDAQNYQHVTQLLHLVQVIAGFTDFDDGLPVLLENKLPDMHIELVFKKSVSEAHKKGTVSEPVEITMEQLMDTITSIAEYNMEGRRAMLTVMAIPLAKFICKNKAEFGLRLEVARTLNVLLQGITSAIRHEYKASPGMKIIMKDLATLIQGAGDFELQITTLEALFRMTSRADRRVVAMEWFPDPPINSAMLHIRDSDFETDCRKFLNILNESLGPEQSVFSFPCKAAYLGTEKLQRPIDDNLTDFWVDFNTSSHSISLFVVDKNNTDQDETGGWETVVIKSTDVKFYMLSEYMGDIRLEMVLNRAACDISEVCAASNKDVTAIFVLKKNSDIPRALDLSLGKDKERQKSRASVPACTPVRLSTYAAADSSMKEDDEITSQSGKEPVKPYSAQKHISGSRTKVSVSTQAMRMASHITSPQQVPRPAARAAEREKTESHCSVTSSTPRTPVGKNTGAVQKKRVKTPLQMVTSAQVSSSQRLGVKVSVPLTYIRLGSSQERRQQEEPDRPDGKNDTGEVVPSSCPVADDVAVPDSQVSQSENHVVESMRDKNMTSTQDADTDQALYIKARLRASDSPALSTVTERTESSRASTHSPPSARQRPSISMEPISEEQSCLGKKDPFRQQKDKSAKPPKKKAKVTPEEVISSQESGNSRSRPRRAAAQAALTQLQHLSQDVVIPDSQPIDPLPKPVKGRVMTIGEKKAHTSLSSATQKSQYDFAERDDMTLEQERDEPLMETVIPDSQPSQVPKKYGGSSQQVGKEKNKRVMKKSAEAASWYQDKQKTGSKKQVPNVAKSPYLSLSQDSALDFKILQRPSQQSSGRTLPKGTSDWNFDSPKSTESMDSSIYDFKEDDQPSFQSAGKQSSKFKSPKNLPKETASQKLKPRIPGKKKGQSGSSSGSSTILKFFTSRNKKATQGSSQEEEDSTEDVHSSSDAGDKNQAPRKGQDKSEYGAKERKTGKQMSENAVEKRHPERNDIAENFGFDYDEENFPKPVQKGKKGESKQSKYLHTALSDTDAPLKKKPRKRATREELTSRNKGPLSESTNTTMKAKKHMTGTGKGNDRKSEKSKDKRSAKWKGVIDIQGEDEELSDLEVMREADVPSPMVTGFFPPDPDEDKEKEDKEEKETSSHISFSKETFYGSKSRKGQKPQPSKQSKVVESRQEQKEKEEMLAKVTKLAEKYTKRMQEKEKAQTRQLNDSVPFIEEYQSQPIVEMSPSLESDSTKRLASHSASTSPKESDAYGGEEGTIGIDDDDDESQSAVVSFQNLCKSLVQKSSSKSAKSKKTQRGLSIFDTTDEDDSRTERSWLLSKSKQKPKPQISHQYGLDKKTSKPKLNWDHDTESTTSSWAPQGARKKTTQKEKRKPKKGGKADKQPKKPGKASSLKEPSVSYGFEDESFPSLEIERTMANDWQEEQDNVAVKKTRARRQRAGKGYKEDSDSDIDNDNYDTLKFKSSTPKSPVDKKRKSKSSSSHLDSHSARPKDESVKPWNRDEDRKVSKQKATSRRFLDAVHVEILKTPKQPTAHRNTAPHKKKGYKELNVNVKMTPKTPLSESGKERAKAKSSRGLELNSSFDPDRWVDSDVPGFLSDKESEGHSGYLSESSEVPGFLSGNESGFLTEEDNEAVHNELSSILPSGNCLASSNVTEDNMPASPCLSVITHISSVKSQFTGSCKVSDKSISYEADEEDHGDGKSTTIASMVSGPSTTVRPSSSMLKRKYGSDSEDDDFPPVSLGLQDMGGGRITLNPKKVIKKSLPAPAASLNTSEISDVDLNMTGDSMEDVSLTPPEDVGLGGVLSSFNAQIMKNIQHKKKQLESFSRSTLKSTQKEVKGLWKGQMGKRMRIQESFKGNLLHELDFLEKEMANLQACEEKALKFFENQQKLLSTARITHEQRFRKILQMEEDFHKTLAQLDREQEQQQISLQESLLAKAQEMSTSFLKNIQQEEMKTMRRALQNMFL